MFRVQALSMDVFHEGMLIAGCPAVLTHLADGPAAAPPPAADRAAADHEDGADYEVRRCRYR
jgi:hypothetical protein